YQIALQGRQDIGLAHDPRMAFEMLLLRMLVFSPELPAIGASDASPEAAPIPAQSTQQADAAPAAADTAPSADEPAQEQKKKPELTQPAPVIDTRPAQQQPPERAPERPPERESDQVDQQPAPVAQQAPQKTQEAQETTAQQPQATPVQTKVSPVPDIENWIGTVEQLGVTGITGNLICNCLPESFDGRVLQLVLDEQQSSLYNEEQGRRIAQVLKGHFGDQIEVRIRTGALAGESPATSWERQRQEHRQQAIKDFENDEHVQSLITHFAARILPDSIKVISEENR